jgi:HAD superfamily hydrolase (TIGR01509 family)
MARAVLWDVDGTLVRNDALHWRTWRDTLVGEGLVLTEEGYAAVAGLTNAATVRALLGERTAADAARIADLKEERYRALVRAEGLAPAPGAIRLLEQLRAAGWRQAVASSAIRLNLEVVLPALGVDGYFDAVVGSEDVERGKPDPEVFLTAAARLDLPPARCVVIEDSPHGVEAARRAGMAVIGVGPRHPTLGSDRAVASLLEIAGADVAALLERG